MILMGVLCLVTPMDYASCDSDKYEDNPPPVTLVKATNLLKIYMIFFLGLPLMHTNLTCIPNPFSSKEYN